MTTDILGVDPGHVTGWARISPVGKILDLGQVKYVDLHDWLNTLTPTIGTFVIENFRIRPGINFSWNEMKTIKVIGALEYRAFSLHARVEFSEPANYKIGAKWGAIPIPKNHDISHQYIAYAHATFYSVHKLKNPMPALQQMKQEQEQG